MRLERVRRDLQERKNLDVYATVLVALVASILSTFDLVSPSRTASLVLAVLAVLAFNVLATRTAIESGAQPQSDRFHAEFPVDMIKRREACEDVYLIGVSLSRTIEHSYGAFERNLRQGRRIRVLLTHPLSDAAALDARGQISRPDPKEIRQEIIHSLKLLASLKKKTHGDLEVRLTRAALHFGLQYLNLGGVGADLHVQLYSFRLSGESRPMFRLTHADGEWFDCFAGQAEALWHDAEIFRGNVDVFNSKETALDEH